MRRPALLLPLLLVACAGVPRPALRPVDVASPRALAEAAEAFYAGQTPAQLREAVEAARAAAPDSALHHELAFTLATMEARNDDALSHLLALLRDTAGDAAPLHLHFLSWLDFTRPQRAAVREHLRALAGTHPSADVRAVAAYQLSGLLHAEGDVEGRDAATASLPGRLAFAVAGTWDNDQGKGYELELAPEQRPGLDETYQGRTGPMAWRPDAPLDPRGRLDLAALMTPGRWAVAYAQARADVTEEGWYALKLATTDPLKVWVDGRLVFAAAQVARAVPDQLVVPVKLSAGAHRVLVKSAHRQGVWFLLGRLVPFAGAGASLDSVDKVVTWHARALPPASGRAWAHLVGWAHFVAGGATTVKTADAWARQAPRSLLARVWQADALWYNQERGRAADALAALDAEVGDALPFVRLRQARFHFQQGLKQKARDEVLPLLRARPDVRDAHDLWVELHRAEGWTEDEAAAIAARAAAVGETPTDVLDAARVELKLGRRAAGLAAYRRLLDWLPLHADALDRLSELHRDAGELNRAEQLLLRRLASWPVDGAAWLDLAEVRRRRGDVEGSKEALGAFATLQPDSATPWVKRGELASEAGDAAAAVGAWRRALELNPDNEALAHRLDFLAPEARGPWLEDVPDEAALARAVKRREGLAPLPGADVAWLLDHEVTLLNNDGSTSNVVTAVLHAFNAQGRDRIMRQRVQSSGRLRVLHAWSVDEKGQRSEASSERSRQIFFRGLQPGSTLVLQYRLDVPPSGYLSRYLTRSWSFQSGGEQRADSAFVLWAPAGTALHERRVGAIERSQARRGGQLRVEWSAKDVPPIVAEPAMPPAVEVAANLRVSTVPDWRTWLGWEQALLEGAFRGSPELEALVKRLGAGAVTGDEKLARVHAFVMEDIRYQQDYESFIAGVKPHPAPMVLERRYGDCKDKAVLFIELAKRLGVEAHFALVRTRDAGPLDVDVPMQQFNHAIVYVPAQPGVAAARFFDPTAEQLDLDVLRADDAGTKSLVFDPVTGLHTWREIPFEPPAAHRETSDLELSLSKDGAAQGTFRLEAKGRTGSLLRRLARNEEVLAQAVQRLAGVLVPGATTSGAKVEEAQSLEKPAALSAQLSAATFARAEGDALRLELPLDFAPRSSFTLASRRHPLVLGVPAHRATRVRLTLPEGWEVKKAPRAGRVELPCLALWREVTASGGTLEATTRYETRCERLSPAEYAQYRAQVDEMQRLLDDELVVAPSPPLPAKRGEGRGEGPRRR